MVGATFEEHRREATRARLRRVTVIAFVPIAAAVPVNLLAFSDRLPERLASFGIEAALCCVAWLLTRTEWARRQAIPLAVGFVVALLTVAMWSLSLSPQDIDVLAGTVAAAMVAAALFFPWGVGPQLIVSSCAAATYVWYVPWLALDPARATNILIVLGNGLLLSSVGAALLNTQRRATFTEHMDARRAEAAQQEAARVWEAQARVARELISAVDRPALLDRLCQVTTEVLRCEAAYTLLRQPDTDAFTGMASHGFSAEEREMARMVDVPQSRMIPILSTLDDSDVGDGRTVAPKSSLGDTQPAVTSSRRLYMGLRRGEAIIGVQVARFPRRQEPFTAKERRIAAGIAQVASMALANAQAIEELERAHRLKSDFVATISHELRTPLNVILGYVEMLDDGTFGYLSTQQMEIVGRIGKSAGELFELITTTLDLSRLESGRVQVDLHDIDLGKLIAEIDAETRELQQKPDVSFAWDLPPALPVLHSDPLKLKVVIKNLIGNAMKFTDHGTVIVSACAHEGGLEFAVRDTGPGVSPEAQAVIFEAFRQGDGSSTRRHGGVGLGLYLVRRLLDMLGGTITLESETGRGSTFTVRLPERPTANRSAA